ncbi:cytochrome c biogenesis CcdA family protein [Janibacter sp. GS2]|uniref:cytochrome c biogenesis CcdA family protein n=1 Tax=Janibacter sp. GS2 TaxID=3442646 RepID=UPI003EB7A25E
MDIGYTGALLGGVLTLLSPCSVMLLPAFFAYAFTSPTALIGRTAVFYAGLSATLIPLGVFAGSLGSLVTTNRSALVAVAAGVVILLGIWQLSGLPVPGLTRTRGAGGDRTSVVSVFALGAVYAVAGVCAGPILGSVLMVAALGGNPVYGGSMLALYALGMTIPLFALAALWKRIGTRGRALVAPREVSLGPWRNTWTMVVSGLFSVAIGVLLLVTDGTASLGGMFTIGTQQAAESTLATWSEGISDVWFVLAVGLVLVVLLGWRRRAVRHRARQQPEVVEGADLVSRER